LITCIVKADTCKRLDYIGSASEVMDQSAIFSLCILRMALRASAFFLGSIVINQLIK
jgi:hypothetical protein